MVQRENTELVVVVVDEGDGIVADMMKMKGWEGGREGGE